MTRVNSPAVAWPRSSNPGTEVGAEEYLVDAAGAALRRDLVGAAVPHVNSDSHMFLSFRAGQAGDSLETA